MRCATCGTENQPDSRFCGGCGAKQPGKTAPTAKIHDDAPYPSAGQPQSGPASIPPGTYGHGPASIPPPAMPTPAPGSMVREPSPPAYGSVPPTNNPASRPPEPAQRHPSRAPNVSAPNVSRAPAQSLGASGSVALPPRRPIGLIAIVLILDLGLAAAGAVMLGKGLSNDKAEKSAPKPEDKPGLKTGATDATEHRPPDLQAAAPSVPSAAAIATATAPASADSAPAPAIVPVAKQTSPAAADKSSASRRGTDKARAAAKPVPKPAGATTASGGTSTGPVTAPQDPYADPPRAEAAAPAAKVTPEQEIDKLYAKSKSAFERCLGAVAPVHGKIEIAFQVLADGRIANTATVDNSTGSTELGSCLARTVSGWTLSPHSGSALNFVRSFNYP